MTNVINEQEWISLLKTIYFNNATTTSSTKITVKTTKGISEPAISIPLKQLKEFHDNLVGSGFSDTEALVITAQVASSARTN